MNDFGDKPEVHSLITWSASFTASYFTLHYEAGLHVLVADIHFDNKKEQRKSKLCGFIRCVKMHQFIFVSIISVSILFDTRTNKLLFSRFKVSSSLSSSMSLLSLSSMRTFLLCSTYSLNLKFSLVLSYLSHLDVFLVNSPRMLLFHYCSEYIVFNVYRVGE